MVRFAGSLEACLPGRRRSPSPTVLQSMRHSAETRDPDGTGPRRPVGQESGGTTAVVQEVLPVENCGKSVGQGAALSSFAMSLALSGCRLTADSRLSLHEAKSKLTFWLFAGPAGPIARRPISESGTEGRMFGTAGEKSASRHLRLA